MPADDNEQILKDLEQAKNNWRQKLVFSEKELAITASAAEKFELIQRIRECQGDFSR